MGKRIIIRADASKKTGYGHFYRSLALASHLKDDFDCWFATYNEDENHGYPYDVQLERILEICNPFPLGLHDDRDSYDKAFLDGLTEGDIVVLDNYYYTTEYQQKIRAKGCILVCIDDMHDRHMVCDLLITGSPLQRSDFSLESHTKFISGIEWIFLREAFFSPNKVRNVKTQIDNVVIAMGGSDAYNITDKIIMVVRKLLPNVIIDVIAGNGVSISNEGINIHRTLTAPQMVNIFDKADIGIFPASTVSIEAVSRRLPVIAGIYADNQLALYDYGVNNKLFAPLGNLLDPEVQIKNRLITILNHNMPFPFVMNFKNQKERTLQLFKEL